MNYNMKISIFSNDGLILSVCKLSVLFLNKTIKYKWWIYNIIYNL